ncbi:phage minor capsid protein [Nocardia sp. NBC_01327]|uniref:phage minor capsid protein n=1 Tax=Nocardia sp. NBC_01327 TaxID=2903593 RepID=UPI002E13C0E2|nr:phage minor capsid protein [Nocardia sp. NBC_01327]
MPISWDRIKHAHESTKQTAADLEQQLIANAASAVKGAEKDLSGTSWWRLASVRRRSRALIGTLVSRAVATARTAVSSATNTGRAEAEKDLRARYVPVTATDTGPIAAAAEREVADKITATAPVAIRSSDRLYSDALSAIIAQPAQSTAHRLRVAQGVLDRLSEAGITGFIDKANRNWNIVSYVEMCTKTIAANAALDAHVHTLSAHGQHLAVIDGAVDCCPVCAPWHGQLVTIDDSAAPAGVQVAGTLDDARAAGVWHPGCRCSVESWDVGDPLPDIPEPDPRLYADRQRLRLLERRVRAGKRVLAAAMTPEAETGARQRIRAHQAEIRAHITATGVKRQRRREQIGRAL